MVHRALPFCIPVPARGREVELDVLSAATAPVCFRPSDATTPRGPLVFAPCRAEPIVLVVFHLLERTCLPLAFLPATLSPDFHGQCGPKAVCERRSGFPVSRGTFGWSRGFGREWTGEDVVQAESRMLAWEVVVIERRAVLPSDG